MVNVESSEIVQLFEIVSKLPSYKTKQIESNKLLELLNNLCSPHDRLKNITNKRLNNTIRKNCKYKSTR